MFFDYHMDGHIVFAYRVEKMLNRQEKAKKFGGRVGRRREQSVHERP